MAKEKTTQQKQAPQLAPTQQSILMQLKTKEEATFQQIVSHTDYLRDVNFVLQVFDTLRSPERRYTLLARADQSVFKNERFVLQMLRRTTDQKIFVEELRKIDFNNIEVALTLVDLVGKITSRQMDDLVFELKQNLFLDPLLTKRFLYDMFSKKDLAHEENRKIEFIEKMFDAIQEVNSSVLLDPEIQKYISQSSFEENDRKTIHQAVAKEIIETVEERDGDVLTPEGEKAITEGQMTVTQDFKLNINKDAPHTENIDPSKLVQDSFVTEAKELIGESSLAKTLQEKNETLQQLAETLQQPEIEEKTPVSEYFKVFAEEAIENVTTSIDLTTEEGNQFSGAFWDAENVSYTQYNPDTIDLNDGIVSLSSAEDALEQADATSPFTFAYDYQPEQTTLPTWDLTKDLQAEPTIDPEQLNNMDDAQQEEVIQSMDEEQLEEMIAQDQIDEDTKEKIEEELEERNNQMTTNS